jgi:hypothetical protein
MNTKVFNLALMTFWLALCVGLWARDYWMPPGLLERANGPQTPLVVAVAGVLAVWNFIRFWIAYQFGRPARPSPTVEAYRRQIRSITGEDPKVTDPQFSFDDPPAGRPGDGAR